MERLGLDFVQWNPVNKSPDNVCNAMASDIPNACSDPLPTPPNLKFLRIM